MGRLSQKMLEVLSRTDSDTEIGGDIIDAGSGDSIYDSDSQTLQVPAQGEVSLPQPNIQFRSFIQDSQFLDEAHDVQIRDFQGAPHAFACGRDDSFGIVDLSDPDNPTVVGGISGSDVSGANALYPFLDASTPVVHVSTGDAGGGSQAVSIIDVSDPANPSVLSRYGGGGFTTANGEHVFVDGAGDRYILWASKGGEVAVAEINDALNPSTVGSLGNSQNFNISSPHDIEVRGRYAYVPSNNGNSGSATFQPIRILDDNYELLPLSDAVWGETISGEFVMEAANRVEATSDGEYIYAATGPNKYFGTTDVEEGYIVVYKSSNTNGLTRVGQAKTNGLFAAGLDLVDDNWLFAASGNYIEAFDIQDPENPESFYSFTQDEPFDGENNSVGSCVHDLELLDNLLVTTAGQANADALVVHEVTGSSISGSNGGAYTTDFS